MYSSFITQQVQQAKDLKQLQAVLKQIESERTDLKCALLLPKLSHQSSRNTWLGNVSKEMKTWVNSEPVKKQLENDYALLPLFYSDPVSSNKKGFVLCTATPGYLSVWLIVESENLANSETDVLGAMALSRYIADACHRFSVQQKQLLTSREQECMRWVAEGKTSWEAAQILGLTERTVNFHIQNCIHKTNSVNRSQAITKCITGALINVSL